MKDDARRKLVAYRELLRWQTSFEICAHRTRYYLCGVIFYGLFSASQAMAALLLLAAVVGFFSLAGIRWILVRRQEALWQALRQAARERTKEVGHAGGQPSRGSSG